MTRLLFLTLGFLSCCSLIQAQDAITPETVEAVKKAAVFIRVESDNSTSSGSGFVVKSDAKSVLIATNDHVATAKGTAKNATITVVFDSGTKTERSYTAQLVATDADRDLAILRVAGVKDPPKPIAYHETPKLVETMQVYSFGFPFGKALSQTKGFPAITVGKASISSLREGSDGELAVVQIDGNLNPGNSGGPVVDAKGRLVGVAVATIKDGQGIGFAVPSRELDKLMQGRIGHVRVVSRKGAEGAVIVRVEAELIDPLGNLRSPTAHYFHVAPKVKQPDTTALDKHPGSKKLELKLEKGLAVAEFNMPGPEGVVLVQVAADAGSGHRSALSRVRSFSLAPPPKLTDLTGKPFPGWKEYSPRDNTFIVWLPEKPDKQTDEERNGTIGGQRMRVNSVNGKSADGLAYQAESVLLPISMAKMPRKDLLEIVSSRLVKELGGKLTDTKDATSGSLTGAEYTIEAGRTVTRARVYPVGSRVYTVQVTGSADEVAGVDAEIILSSYRVPGAVAPVAKKDLDPGPSKLPNPIEPKAITGGKEPTILGSIENDPKFKTIGPEGGILIGVEARFAKFGGTEIVRAVRPIYRVSGKEQFGEQFGADLTGSVTIKAKEGYAVGGVVGKAGWWCNGFSLTFMKIKPDGTLDPKDSYESDWAGFNGRSAIIRVMSDGAPVVGIVGKIVGRETTAFGLLYKGQEDFDPKKKK
jgi:S1-C subfamily serine protease